MAGTTTNNSWDYPTSTDLVTNGALAIQTLADEIDTSVGAGLKAWQTWAPTLSNGWANGNGTWSAQYAKLGKLVFVSGIFTLGTTTTKGTGCNVSLPVAARTGSMIYAFKGILSAAGTSYELTVAGATTTTMSLLAQNTAGTYLTRATVTSTVPATWVTGDEIRFIGFYEAA